MAQLDNLREHEMSDGPTGVIPGWCPYHPEQGRGSPLSLTGVTHVEIKKVPRIPP